MKIVSDNVAEKDASAEALVLPLFEGQSAEIYEDIDSLSGKVISGLISSGDFSGRLGQTMLVPVKGLGARRLLPAGLGKHSEFSNEKARRAGAKAFKALSGCNLTSAALSVRNFGDAQPEAAFSFLEGGLLGLYRYDRYRTERPDEAPQRVMETVSALCEEGLLDTGRLMAVVSAVSFARDMVNMPANDMTPSALAGIAKGLEASGVKVTVMDLPEIEKEGMGAYLSVTKGSDQPPKFIVAEYMKGKGAPVVIVGKAVTFDSGGLDIKPGSSMVTMKDDMSGAAAALAVMKTVAESCMAVNLVVILPAVENLLGGSASRPGDVVTTITGKTVEIISTDAEGRLTLADAIGYAVKYYAPAAIIDIATLTGACDTAFGNEASAMMGNNQELMERLRAVSEKVYERLWPMPLFDEYGEYLKSDIADIKNVGGRKGSLCASAWFLKDFAGTVPWAHLDIAGAAWNETERPYSPKGASGMGVRLLLEFLRAS
jgi:leucyl aminopeptidase